MRLPLIPAAAPKVVSEQTGVLPRAIAALFADFCNDGDLELRATNKP